MTTFYIKLLIHYMKTRKMVNLNNYFSLVLVLIQNVYNVSVFRPQFVSTFATLTDL